LDVAVFGENMVDDGYQDVVNIDISSVVIEQMKKKYHDKPQLKCMLFVPNILSRTPRSIDCLLFYIYRYEDGCKEHVRL
jgi:hypothetical protein